jgi:uncharacterized protein (TIGR03435 family)
MAYFVQILTDNLDRPVIDKTNLTGNYDFDLTYEGPPWSPGLSSGRFRSSASN